ncbi:hypothetical protein TTRE_0000518201 [Trichuris trichiura]|uniref:Tight junction-associated protein 1 n=1 Tax=Trichuris trichiura TaxID=36087 RepID=A0A077ZAQ3_TRITR|nr:hypothetical protein TTRE_0000518201 [Trichuris trichiura]
MKKTAEKIEMLNDVQAEVVLWKEKYERLLHTFTLTLENNQKLEDSVLKLIDQSEEDKASMVNEVDHLNQLIAVKDAMINRATFPPTAVMLATESPPQESLQKSPNSLSGHSEDILQLIGFTSNSDLTIRLTECNKCSSAIRLRDQSVQTEVSSVSNEQLLIDFNIDDQKHSMSVHRKEHSVLLI